MKWYKVAAEKFRRADWKKKAEEALTRMGVHSPEQDQPKERDAVDNEVEPATMMIEDEARVREGFHAPPQHVAAAAPEEDETDETGETEEEDEVSGNVATSGPSSTSSAAAEAAKKKRRRGRRGGRGRRRKGAPTTQGLPSQAYAPATSAGSPHVPSHAQPHSTPQPFSSTSSERERVPHEPPARKAQPEARPEPVYRAPQLVPQLPSERAAHGRSDPGLSSRMAQLESLLRRLLNSPLHRLGEADEAPAGPGVFLISDSDQTTSYYIEACQTLRVGVGNLGRGARTQKGTRSAGRNFSDSNFKEKFAEHLGINETKVSQYMKDHCVVRWIQLDDEAANLAHFAIGLLRTPLNTD